MSRSDIVEQNIQLLIGEREVDETRACQVAKRIADTFKVELPAIQLDLAPAFHRFPFTLLTDAWESLPADKAFQLLESEDLKTLARRLWAVEYLSDEGVPLYSLPELEHHLDVFIKHLERDRKHLIKTGLPQHCFRPCRWLYLQLGRLYDVKATGSPWPHDEIMRKRKGMPKMPAYNWVKHVPHKGFLGIESTGFEHCAYEEADLLRDMDSENAQRLEASRARLFDLRIKVLRELHDAVSREDCSQLWKKCLKLLTDTVLGDEADFLLGMDRSYIGVDARSDGAAEASPKMIPGGLTNLLEVIGQCEKEIAIGTLANTRQQLGNLVDPAKAERFRTGRRHNGNAYYWFYGRPEQSHLDAALDQFLALSAEETDFWPGYRQRVNEALENEFYNEVAIRTKVKRRLVDDFEPKVRTFADLVKAHLESSGQSSRIEFSVSMAIAGRSGKRHRGGKGAVAEKRRWTQPELDDAIRKYKTERASSYHELVNRVAEGAKGAKKAAQDMFGRNAIARALGVRSGAMVTNSAAWQEIAIALQLPCKANKLPSIPRPARIGHEIAMEAASQTAVYGDDYFSGLTTIRFPVEAIR